MRDIRHYLKRGFRWRALGALVSAGPVGSKKKEIAGITNYSSAGHLSDGPRALTRSKREIVRSLSR
jgi:hypothetical protein